MRNFLAGLVLGLILAFAASDIATSEVLASPEPEGPRVTGIGGVFFTANDPAKLSAWYREHLGFAPNYGRTTVFEWRELDRPDVVASTVWGPFPKSTKYFRKEGAQWMTNFRVVQLDALLDALRKKGVVVEEKIQSDDYGRFAWIYDLEGNRVELWEPTAVAPPKYPAEKKQ